MAYRDTFEKCPRCAVELVDARSARGCRSCGGLWVEEAVVSEMVLAMLPPRPLGRLQLAILERTGAPIGCPACGVAMEATTIHDVMLDRCAKHGVWFDAMELEEALHRVADPARGDPPLVELAPAIPLGATRQPVSTPEPAHGVELRFLVHPPALPAHEVRVRREVVKIGKLATSHVRIDDDDRASRMHAVIEATDRDRVVLIDLGSAAGTHVNGRKVNQVVLRSGDRIQVGATLLDLTIVAT